MSTEDTQPPTEDSILLPRCPSLYIRTNTPKGRNEDKSPKLHHQVQKSKLLLTTALSTPGRGVFTSATIAQGTILDVCPVLVFEPNENANHIAQTQLYHYTYNWPIRKVEQKASNGSLDESSRPHQPDQQNDDQSRRNVRPPTQTQALILGLGSMFNHRSASSSQSLGSGHPSLPPGQNVGWKRDVEKETVTYFALREILAGEEMCISYGDRLTFVDSDAALAGREGEAEEAEEVLGRIELGGIADE